MIAGAIPKSLKILKNEMMTVAIATTPNSSGSISRASTPATAKEMMIPEYFDIAVYIIPDANSFCIDAIFF